MADDNETTTFEGYITKYVGLVIKRTFRQDPDTSYAFSVDKGNRFWGKVGRDIWLTEAEAEADARRRVLRKVRSLEKQIATLQGGPYGSEEKGRG